MNTIILEGPDGAGKSTLAKTFSELGYSIIPFGVPPSAARKNEESIFHFFFDTLYSCGEQHISVVFDRLHLSDYIYGAIMRDEHVMTPRVQALIERYIEAIDGQIIICLPPRRVAYANWAGRYSQEYVKDVWRFNLVYSAYAKLLFSWRRNRNFLWYDYTRHRVGSFVNAISAWRGFPLPTGVVGSQRPKFLFVGDRPGPGEGPNLPFMTTKNCSGWLFDVIREAGYEEDEIAFVNAIGKNGEPFDLEMLLAYLTGRGLKETIALGARANTVLEKFGGAWTTVMHPQHAKRFKSKERAAYVAELKKIRKETK